MSIEEFIAEADTVLAPLTRLASPTVHSLAFAQQHLCVARARFSLECPVVLHGN